MFSYLLKTVAGRGCQFRAALLLLSFFLTQRIQAAPIISADSPIGFFTNVASRLLRTELNVDLNHIPIYPTNQYTPALHRLLQVTANLYDATTNRFAPGYPFPPGIYRPLFRRDAQGEVFIAAYREVLGLTPAVTATAPPMVDLTSDPVSEIPDIGTPFGSEQDEPLVAGIPLVIGARKGFPNFNEFAMQTGVAFSRLIEFRRAPNDIFGPVVATNQMYVVSITNNFGLEAWNSYAFAYPRHLQIQTTADMIAVLTNELGAMVSSNRISQGSITNLNASTWLGWSNVLDAANSFVLPWGNTSVFYFLTNSTYVNHPPWFEPQSHNFSDSAIGEFYFPHLWLNLKIRLRYILVDADASCIVDYVNLSYAEPPVDIASMLAQGATCSGNPANLDNPAEQWCTNRAGPDPTNSAAPTYGVLSQIQLGLGFYMGLLPPGNFTVDPYTGPNLHQDTDGFRWNLMGWSPIYPEDQGMTFYKSNVFYAPLIPVRTLYVHSSFQANDPLVHYLISDLLDFGGFNTNRIDFVAHNPPLDNLSYLNAHYQPWNGNPSAHINPPIGPYDLSAKDPLILRSDSWNFPTNQPLSGSWIGSVHRGTPWQTIYLKSTAVDPFAWQSWIGNPGYFDAQLMRPTNDWHLASFLALLFNLTDPRSLSSANLSTADDWTGLLNGMVALTNVSAQQLDEVIMTSNSPQAAVMANGILANKASQTRQTFADFGDIFSTPALSAASPWLSPSYAEISDQAYEIIPSQLLALLRPDSLGSVAVVGGNIQVQFTGFDDYRYIIQSSSDLHNWTSLGTNNPVNGTLLLSEPISPAVSARFYRSVLAP
jgi:hypothetical protein